MKGDTPRRVLALALAVAGCQQVLAIPDRKDAAHLECTAADQCTCTSGFGDCDKDPNNGCETDLTSNQDHCGDCDAACVNGRCSDARCTCAAGFVDCDHDPTTGCEAELAKDAKNCGFCGHDCRGASCSAGRCEPITLGSGLSSPKALVLDGGFVYWASTDIYRVATSGGKPHRLTDGEAVDDLVGSGGVLYLASELSSAVKRLDPPSQVTTLAPLQSGVRNVATGGGHVYWTTSMGGTVMRIDPSGAGITTLATMEDQPAGIAVAEGTVFFDTPLALRAVSSAGGAVSMRASVTALVVRAFGDELFVGCARCDGDDDAVIAFPVAGGAPRLISKAFAPSDIAADDVTVAWTNRADGTVMVAPRAGGDAVAIAAQQDAPSSIALDDDYVYWTTSTSVKKVAR